MNHGTDGAWTISDPLRPVERGGDRDPDGHGPDVGTAIEQRASREADGKCEESDAVRRDRMGIAIALDIGRL